MEALSLEAGGAISATDLKVDVKRREGLNICQHFVCVGGRGPQSNPKDTKIGRDDVHKI